MIIYYKGQTIKNHFGWTRQRLSKVALREEWQIREDTWPLVYRKQDVQDYCISREHTEKAIELGLWSGSGWLIRHKNGVNKNCPICKKVLQGEEIML